VLGVVAAAAERPTVPLDDNLRIALAVAFAASVLGLR
jgi:dolichol kinase